LLRVLKQHHHIQAATGDAMYATKQE